MNLEIEKKTCYKMNINKNPFLSPLKRNYQSLTHDKITIGFKHIKRILTTWNICLSDGAD